MYPVYLYTIVVVTVFYAGITMGDFLKPVQITDNSHPVKCGHSGLGKLGVSSNGTSGLIKIQISHIQIITNDTRQPMENIIIEEDVYLGSDPLVYQVGPVGPVPQHNLTLHLHLNQTCASIEHLTENQTCPDRKCYMMTSWHCERRCTKHLIPGSNFRLPFITVLNRRPRGRHTDLLRLTVRDDRQRLCNDGITFGTNNSSTETCKVGDLCRITVMYKYPVSGPEYSVGCETDWRQPNAGCEWQGCRENVTATDNSINLATTYDRICKYCCHSNQCNDLNKCRDGKCYFYSTIPGTPSRSNSLRKSFIGFIFKFILTTTFIFFN